MPIIKKPRKSESERHLVLLRELAAELKRETEAGPTIIEEEQQWGDYLHVTVIWDPWKDVEPAERGRIIMDAYERQRPNDVAKITVALGLTHEEASRLGIKA